MNFAYNLKINRHYYYSCLLFILLIPLENIYLFDIGFKGSCTNLLIILSSTKLFFDYCISYKFRQYFKYRIYSYESKCLLLPLLILTTIDIVSSISHACFWFITDRIGTILLIIMFIIGVENIEKSKKLSLFWIFSASYMATQNILSNFYITPAIEGSRFHNPRNFFGFDMPFNYAVGFPGDFGWHGMILISGFLFAVHYYKSSKIISLFGSLLSLSSIIMLQSRSTYLALMISIIIYFFIFSLVSKKFKIVIFFCLPMTILVIFYFSYIFDYIINVWEGFLNVTRATVDGRLFQYKLSIKTGFSNIFLGAGHDYSFNGKLEHVVHNSFLHQFYSIGIIGFFVYCYIYYNAIKSFIRYMLLMRTEYYDSSFIIILFSSFIGVCIELLFFRVISGKIQWLIIYMILINSSIVASKKRSSSQIQNQVNRGAIEFA